MRIKCDRCFTTVPFVVLTVGQFVGCVGGPLKRQIQDSHIYRKTAKNLSKKKKKKSEKLLKRNGILDGHRVQI